MTTWNPQIPNVNNVPANDAQSMQQNFSVLNTSFAIDHVPLQLATNQGQHKQVTFSQPPAALPFAPNAQNSFAYERMLAGAATKSFLEYQSAGLGPNNIVPLSLKAWAIFNSNLGVAPFMNILASFNINVATSERVGAAFIMNFLEPLPSINYMIFTGRFGQQGTAVATVKTVNNVTITASVLAGTDEFYLAVL